MLGSVSLVPFASFGECALVVSGAERAPCENWLLVKFLPDPVDVFVEE
jgi:hypothetical protein